VAETNKHYAQHLDTIDTDGRCSQLPNITVQETIVLRMGHDVNDTLRSYWSTAKQFFAPFYINTVKCD